MKYEKEVNEIWDLIFIRESWMNDEDYKEFIDLTNKTLGTSKKKISDDLEIGVKNGYSVEYQMNLIRKVILNEKQ